MARAGPCLLSPSTIHRIELSEQPWCFQGNCVGKGLDQKDL